MSTVLLLMIFWNGKLEMTTQHFHSPGACEAARVWIGRQHEGAAAVVRSTCLPDVVEHQR